MRGVHVRKLSYAWCSNAVRIGPRSRHRASDCRSPSIVTGFAGGVVRERSHHHKEPPEDSPLLRAGRRTPRKVAKAMLNRKLRRSPPPRWRSQRGKKRLRKCDRPAKLRTRATSDTRCDTRTMRSHLLNYPLARGQSTSGVNRTLDRARIPAECSCTTLRGRFRSLTPTRTIRLPRRGMRFPHTAQLELNRAGRQRSAINGRVVELERT